MTFSTSYRPGHREFTPGTYCLPFARRCQHPTMRLSFIFTFLFLSSLSTIFISPAHASEGDQRPEFRNCVTNCIYTTCSQNPQLPLSLRLTFWTCPQNCQYTCMQTITEISKASDKPIVQYYGKWPFYRLLGIQEPASVVFSIGNGYMHYRHWSILRREIPVGYQMRPYYLGWVVVGVNSWLWSAVFHTRDFSLTEKLDYFSAGASILYSLFFSVIRAYRVRNRLVISAWATLCIVCFLAHISYLSFVHFNYRYNMIANVIVAALHNLLWIGWSAWQYGPWARAGGRNSSFAWYPALGVVLISLAMVFEIFDFPPVGGVFDAHSLWHLSTIPLISIWYQFMIKDTRFEVGVGLTDQKRKI